MLGADTSTSSIIPAGKLANNVDAALKLNQPRNMMGLGGKEGKLPTMDSEHPVVMSDAEVNDLELRLVAGWAALDFGKEQLVPSSSSSTHGKEQRQLASGGSEVRVEQTEVKERISPSSLPPTPEESVEEDEDVTKRLPGLKEETDGKQEISSLPPPSAAKADGKELNSPSSLSASQTLQTPLPHSSSSSPSNSLSRPPLASLPQIHTDTLSTIDRANRQSSGIIMDHMAPVHDLVTTWEFYAHAHAQDGANVSLPRKEGGSSLRIQIGDDESGVGNDSEGAEGGVSVNEDEGGNREGLHSPHAEGELTVSKPVENGSPASTIDSATLDFLSGISFSDTDLSITTPTTPTPTTTTPIQ
ncbi:hypothetical protein HK104_006598, partial [Borealophlyctis nickersoniae]